MFWAAKFPGERATQISDRISKIRITVERVVKFGEDRPNDLRDQAAKRKKDLSDSSKTEWPAASIA